MPADAAPPPPAASRPVDVEAGVCIPDQREVKVPVHHRHLGAGSCCCEFQHGRQAVDFVSEDDVKRALQRAKRSTSTPKQS